MNNLFHSSALGAAIVLLCYSEFSQAETKKTSVSHFSESRLRALGIDPAAAAYFAQGARFSPGVTDAELVVNGARKGMQKLVFGLNGELCVYPEFLTLAGLQSSKLTEPAECPALTAFWTTATVTLKPAEQEVHIVVPPEAVIRQGEVLPFQRGGTAGLLNYSAYRSYFETTGMRSVFSNLSLESGFNSGDWMVRGAHNLAQMGEGETEFTTAWVYAQKTLVEQKKLFQAGQISFSGGLFSGAPINGIQLLPESILSRRGSGAQVSGIARVDQSRVEVRQNAILIDSTLVPAGPFTLTDLPLLDTTNDLQLTVISPDGQSEVFSVTAASFLRRLPPLAEGGAFALGRLRADSISSEYRLPWVASWSDNLGISQQAQLEYTVLAASDYLAAAAGIMIRPGDALYTRFSVGLTQDRNHGQHGLRSTMSVNWQGPQNLRFGSEVSLYTPGYRELMDSIQSADASYNRVSAGLNMGWYQKAVGYLSLSVSQARLGDNRTETRRLMAAWDRQFGRVNFSANWQRQSRKVQDCSTVSLCGKGDRDSLFVNLSFPLGSQRVSSYYRESSGSAVVGLQTSSSLTENSNWSLAAERNMAQQRSNVLSGSLGGNMRYTTAGLHGSVFDRGQNYSVTLSGGVVVHPEGVILSPHKVNETFGVVVVEPALGGVEIETPRGRVWTDWWGRAVVPGLPAYAPARVELNTERLPNNIDISNGHHQIVAGHGAVTRSGFTLLQSRNGIITVMLADGSLLPKGSIVTTEEGSYVTTAVDDGMIFLSNLNDKKPLIAHWREHICSLSYAVPKEIPKDSVYESISATCNE